MNKHFQFNVRTLLEVTTIFGVVFAASPFTSMLGAIILALIAIALIARLGALAIFLMVTSMFAAQLGDIITGREMAPDYSGYLFANFLVGCVLITYVRFRRHVHDKWRSDDQSKKSKPIVIQPEDLPEKLTVEISDGRMPGETQFPKFAMQRRPTV